jgi:putative transposase
MHHRCRTRERPDNPAPACENSQVEATATKRPREKRLHSGIGWHTPASVHFGTAEEVRDQRAVTLATAYTRHPERFARRPTPPEIPRQAWINDPAKRSQTTQQIS